MEIFGLLIGLALILLCVHVRNWRSKEHQSRCPQCGKITKANGASSGMKYAGGAYIHNYHCKACDHKWSN